MTGVIYWFNPAESPDPTEKELKADFEPRTLGRGNIIPNAQFKNEILIFDIIHSEEYYGGSFRVFLYEDEKFIGKLTWLTNEKEGPEDVRGTYEKTSVNKIKLRGTCTEGNGAVDGFFVELKRIK